MSNGPFEAMILEGGDHFFVDKLQAEVFTIVERIIKHYLY